MKLYLYGGLVMNEDIPEYYRERPALLKFGNDFVEYAYDKTIERYYNAYEKKGNPKFLEKIEPYINSFSEEQMVALKLLTKKIIFDSMLGVLDRFELNLDFKLIVQHDGKETEISKLNDDDPYDSNEFLFDMIGEDGLINILSKYGIVE